MKRLIYIVLALLAVVIVQSCKEQSRLDHIDTSEAAPGQVTNIKVENTPGGAMLTYKLNADISLSYVKAVYEIQPGVFKESKSSIYTDTLRLEGFGDTKEHEVKVYSIGKNEKISEPVTVKIQPLTPPVELAYGDLSIEPGFGGVKVRIKNTLKANLAIVIDADTAGAGVLRPLQTFYTAAAAGSYSIRGLSSKQMKFSVYLRDRWGNKSLAIVKDLTPLFEQRVPKPFGTYILPTDQAALSSAYALSFMWDGVASTNIYASGNNTPIPQWFSIDLKVPVVLSRMKEHQRTDPYTYTGACVKSFELYGSNAPALDGSWASWTLIGKFDSYKPSGAVGVTKEDIAYGYTNGEDFEMPDTPPAYRYLRFKTLETWGGTGQVTISELTFWGKF
ncbi:DUF5000 domain-containing lipoprotein [Pedobacter heparinus]|uniref:DUF4959 domain-containing protein n=1 Tax=Pedobacter heparinus (strain ATCC 13125 / DSM 2366 / CIP 104194 / JCM 7457 / NBRC 12017 / NCIMB 9290 / NRRL B-14731 / HIM 762-3) TaxID=485917 RepID=C6XWK1_PEDHD|nr:DUF5000 domain-containing lipoprotein [Pedobacter heparinus]ACU06290.1 hypothetical protein Phep_4099 [Pedobacter heparinus DSM 2366]